jgi:glycosyltransferase involved in cell wall biosynthesis
MGAGVRSGAESGGGDAAREAHAHGGGPVRVLLVTTVYPPAIGGPSLQTQQIAEGLRRRGVEAHVVAFGPADREEVAGGVPVTRLDPMRNPVPGALGRQVYLYRRVLGLLDRLRPDVVHVQVLGPFGVAAGLACRRRGIPVMVKYTDDMVWKKLNRRRNVGHIYSHGLYHASLRGRWFSALQTGMLRVFARVWATSPFLESQLRDVFRIPAERVFGFPNLIEVDRFERIPLVRTRPAGTPLRVLLASRLVAMKGVETAIRAMAKLQPGVARLRIVGSGREPLQRYLDGLVRELGVEDRVEFAGAVPPGEIAREFQDADLFMLPTEYEAFGIAFVEAMAAGLPVLATRVGGVPAVVPDGEAGVLLEPRDVDGFARVLGEMAADPARRERMGAAGRARARRLYALEERLGELVALYGQMLRETRSRLPLPVPAVFAADEAAA